MGGMHQSVAQDDERSQVGMLRDGTFLYLVGHCGNHHTWLEQLTVYEHVQECILR